MFKVKLILNVKWKMDNIVHFIITVYWGNLQELYLGNTFS